MSVQIRPAELQDLTAILNIFNQEILNGTANWRNQALSLEEYTQWYHQLLRDQFPLLVAVESTTQQILGFADYGSFRSLIGYKNTVEHSVFIHPDFQGLGLGKALMLKLIEHARQQHLHIMIAAIDAENSGSILLHEKLGFKQTGYMPEVGQKFGKWRDLVLMQFNLDA
ncbi:GNAT family N-acetyltransferase [Acinetobacter sp. ANC 3903]|uniref:GNAT family N-acetyltransferase n=1 Tax=Acinetobacter sp. ANC 3903 TaxID=1977883 RepID=UPI000A343F5B|nr:GNAT family N-acetyltransferase [Acinetobacter sp. ANC 3903]OTG58967.1 GNAT family N-acetyltransferase [Acinetobacter sp. ANC 3903]